MDESRFRPLLYIHLYILTKALVEDERYRIGRGRTRLSL